MKRGRKAQYIRVRMENVEEYIAHMMAWKSIGYHYNGAIELAEHMGMILDEHAIELRAEEIKKLMNETK